MAMLRKDWTLVHRDFQIDERTARDLDRLAQRSGYSADALVQQAIDLVVRVDAGKRRGVQLEAV